MLSPKQQRFCDEYLIDLNATQAAIRAGYSAKTAEATGSRLLRNVKVAAAISAAQQSRQQRVEITADRVIAELAAVAFSDVGQVLDFAGEKLALRKADQIPEAARRAIASVKVKRTVEGQGEDALEVETTEFRLWPKVDALEKLCRHLGLFDKDKLQVDLKVRTAEELDDSELHAIAATGRTKPG